MELLNSFFMLTENHKVATYKEYHSVCPSSELGLPPTPHPQASVPPPPCFGGEGNSRWRERGWESPNSDEGHTLWYSLYVRTLCWKPYQNSLDIDFVHSAFVKDEDLKRRQEKNSGLIHVYSLYTATKADQNEALHWKIAVRNGKSTLLVPEHFFLVFYIPP